MIEEKPVPGLRQKQKAETCALIVEAAKSLFENLGFEKTTMKKIAAKVGISPGAIFKHFDSKSALLASALFNDIEAVQEKAIADLPGNDTIENKFLFITRRFFEYYSIRPALSRVLVEHSLFIKGDWAEKFKAQNMKLISEMDLLIGESINRGEIKKETDRQTLAAACFSHYLFVLILCVKEPEIDPVYAINLLKPFIRITFSGAYP